MSELILQIRCNSSDTKTDFKTLTASLDETYEETLIRLMKLEKEHPLQKKAKGKITRL